jgi:hypothetical protein
MRWRRNCALRLIGFVDIAGHRGTGFIREDVGAFSERVRACPGLFANKFAPTISKSTRFCRTGFIREGVAPSARESEPVPASSRINSLLRFRNRRDSVGPDLSGKMSVHSARESEPVPTSSRINSLLRFRNRRDSVGPDLSGRTSVQTTHRWRLRAAPKHRISHDAVASLKSQLLEGRYCKASAT